MGTTAKTSMVFALAVLAVSAGRAYSTDAQYECASGTRLQATFSSPDVSPGSVVLVFSGSTGEVKLPQVVAADGGRYADTDMEFWIKGRDATLTRGGKSEACHSK